MLDIHADFVRKGAHAGVLFLVIAVSGIDAFLLRQQFIEQMNIHQMEHLISGVLRGSEKADDIQAIGMPRPHYEASARELHGQFSVSWPVLLGALETARVQGVHLTRLEYGVSPLEMAVEVTYPTLSDLLRYADALNAESPLERPRWHWTLIKIERTQGTGETGRAWLTAHLKPE